MALTVLTPASTRWLTTAQALYQDTGNVHFLEEPSLTAALIAAASAAIESYCGRIFAQQQYLEVLGQRPDQYFLLSQRPIVTLDSLMVGETEIDDYRLDDAEAGILFRRNGWGRLSGLDTIDVTYVAGYLLPEQTSPPAPTGPALPHDVERAAIESVKVWFHERLPESRVVSRTLGDQRIDYGVQAGRTALPVLTQDLLAPYRRLRVA